MCRSIKVLRTPAGQPADAEIREAALQYVRKISGYRHPSHANTAVFEAAVDDVATISKDLLAAWYKRPRRGSRRLLQLQNDRYKKRGPYGPPSFQSLIHA